MCVTLGRARVTKITYDYKRSGNKSLNEIVYYDGNEPIIAEEPREESKIGSSDFKVGGLFSYKVVSPGKPRNESTGAPAKPDWIECAGEVPMEASRENLSVTIAAFNYIASVYGQNPDLMPIADLEPTLIEYSRLIKKAAAKL